MKDRLNNGTLLVSVCSIDCCPPAHIVETIVYAQQGVQSQVVKRGTRVSPSVHLAPCTFAPQPAHTQRVHTLHSHYLLLNANQNQACADATRTHTETYKRSHLFLTGPCQIRTSKAFFSAWLSVVAAKDSSWSSSR